MINNLTQLYNTEYLGFTPFFFDHTISIQVPQNTIVKGQTSQEESIPFGKILLRSQVAADKHLYNNLINEPNEVVVVKYSFCI